MASADGELRRLVADLARADEADVKAVLARLTFEEQRAVLGHLSTYRSHTKAKAPSVGLERLAKRLSPWLQHRLALSDSRGRRSWIFDLFSTRRRTRPAETPPRLTNRARAALRQAGEAVALGLVAPTLNHRGAAEPQSRLGLDRWL